MQQEIIGNNAPHGFQFPQTDRRDDLAERILRFYEEFPSPPDNNAAQSEQSGTVGFIDPGLSLLDFAARMFWRQGEIPPSFAAELGDKLFATEEGERGKFIRIGTGIVPSSAGLSWPAQERFAAERGIVLASAREILMASVFSEAFTGAPLFPHAAARTRDAWRGGIDALCVTVGRFGRTGGVLGLDVGQPSNHTSSLLVGLVQKFEG